MTKQSVQECKTLYHYANIPDNDFNILYTSIKELENCNNTPLITDEITHIIKANNPNNKKSSNLVEKITANKKCSIGKEVYICGSRGIDAYTRNKIKKALSEFLQIFDIDFVIEYLITIEINILCMKNKVRVTVQQAAKNILELLKHSDSFSLLQTRRQTFYQRNKGRYKTDPSLINVEHIESMPEQIFISTIAGLKLISKTPERFPLHSKGLGTFCINPQGIKSGDFIDYYLGLLYPMWRWFEREENLKALRTKFQVKEIQPNFYNMVLERLNGDEDGFNCVMVSPINKGNFTSRISHSCNPNLKVKNILINGEYKLIVKAIKDIDRFEELSFDYNCRSDILEEVKKAICLCGVYNCRGSYIYYFDDGFSDFYLLKYHPLVSRFRLLIEATELTNYSLSQANYNSQINTNLQKRDLTNIEVNNLFEKKIQEIKELLQKYKFGKSLLGKAPLWLSYYVGLLLKFITAGVPHLEDKISEYRKLFPSKHLSDSNSNKSKSKKRKSSNKNKEIEIKENIERTNSSSSGSDSNSEIGREIKETDKIAIKADGEFITDKYVHSCSIFINRIKYFLNYQTEEVKNTPPIIEADISSIINFYQGILNKVREFVRTSSDSKTNFNLLNKLDNLQEFINTTIDLELIRNKIIEFCFYLNTQRPRRKKSFNVVTDLLFLKANTKRFYKTTKYKGFISEFADIGIIKGKNLRDNVIHKKYNSDFVLVYSMYWFKDTTENNKDFFDYYRKGVLQLPSIDSYMDDKFTSKLEYLVYRNEKLKGMENRMNWPFNDQVGFREDIFIGSPLLDLECGEITEEEYMNVVEKYRNLINVKKA